MKNLPAPPSPRRTIAFIALGVLVLGAVLAVYVLSRGDAAEEAAYAQQRKLRDEEDQARFIAEMRKRQAAEQRSAAEQDDREQQQRAQREREKIAERQAADDAAHARDNAWKRFYTPSAFCQSYEGTTTMQCANEAARARKEFEERWDAGELR
jgi:hypothetical protein